MGFMVCASLAAMFYLVYFKGGRRLLDLLAGNFVLCASGLCLTSFLSDNLIPAGMNSWGWPGGPTAEMLKGSSLEINRWAWACAVIGIPSQLHFVLSYCRKRNFLSRYIWVVYGVAALWLPIIWSSWFIVAPNKPDAATSSWTTTFPWMPDAAGPAPTIVIAMIFAVQVYGVACLWRARKLSQAEFAESAAARRIVLFALLCQAVIGVGDGAASAMQLTIPALTPVGSGIMGVMLAIALIRSRVEADRVRQQLASEKAALLECIPQPLLYFSSDSRLQWANDHAVAFAGRAQEGLPGSSLGEIWSKAAGQRPPVELAWEKGQQVTSEFVDSDRATWMVNASPVKDRGGKPVGAVVLATDITEIRRAQEALRDTNIKILAAREEECRRVARDLHDSVAQGLTSLQMHLCAGAAKAMVESPERKQLEFASKRCSDLGKEVRQISHQLYPPALDLLGLAAALDEVLIPYRSADIQGTVLCDQDTRRVRLSQDAEVALYRIAQEGISNAVRHGKATKIDVQLRQAGQEFVLTVTDNGGGFDVAKKGNGLGMTSMKSRIAGVRGRLELASEPGRTCVKATVAMPVAVRAAS